MEEIKLLFEDYKRRLKTAITELEKSENDLTIKRLRTKVCCYRTFISELQSALANQSDSTEQLNKPAVSVAVCGKCGSKKGLVVRCVDCYESLLNEIE